jgi:type I restriction-modification system DNA methylase subunit
MGKRYMSDAKTSKNTSLVTFIWKNAEDLYDVGIKHIDYSKIILPFMLLRRLECVLEPTRGQVLENHKALGQSAKELAMEGNLHGAVQGGVVLAMSSSNALAKLLLQGARQAMGILTNIIYGFLKSGDKIDLNGITNA